MIDDKHHQILSRKKLKELLEQVDPDEKLDTEVESILLELADDFIVNVTKSACQLAKHRQSDMLEVKDLQVVLESMYNIRVPGFGSDEQPVKSVRKPTAATAHTQRLAQVKKAVAVDMAEKEKEKSIRRQRM